MTQFVALRLILQSNNVTKCAKFFLRAGLCSLKFGCGKVVLSTILNVNYNQVKTPSFHVYFSVF